MRWVSSNFDLENVAWNKMADVWINELDMTFRVAVSALKKSRTAYKIANICMIAPISINSYRRRIKPRYGKSKSQKETCESCKEEVSLRKEALIAGLIVGIFSGILMVEYTNHFGTITSSLFNIPILGSLYVAVVALAFNLIISFGGSSILNRRSKVTRV